MKKKKGKGKEKEKRTGRQLNEREEKVRNRKRWESFSERREEK